MSLTHRVASLCHKEVERAYTEVERESDQLIKKGKLKI
jgi:hypothetical protein